MVNALRGLVTVALLSLLFNNAQAAEIRFYKINKKDQQSEIRLVKNRDEPGCHNLRRKRDVYRVAQVGFTYCSIYPEKDCPDDAALTMEWRGKVKKNSVRAQPGARLMPGDLWFFNDTKPREVRSWVCVRD